MSDTAVSASTSVKLAIDGQNLEVKPGTTILSAARDNGIYIPTLCYLKKLLPIGSCRVCSVEVDGSDGPVMSCITPVTEGMSVTTVSEALSEHRQRMIQFILVNHPLDCPVCERSGECSLQNKTFEFGVTEQVFSAPLDQKIPVKDWQAIRYDQNLCIMCERCVKICREVQGFNALKIDGTGYTAKINTVDGEKLDCDFCGQCLSVCPVGALSSSIVISARSWELTKTESVCPHCAVGCSYHVNVKNGRIVRVTSEDQIGVNDGALCVRGRFGFEAFQTGDRLKTPLVKNGVKLEPVEWDKATKIVVDKLSSVVAEHGKESVAVIASERIANEDAYLLQKLFRAGFGVNRINTISNMRNSALNSGLFDQFGQVNPISDYKKIDNAGSFLFFGCDAANENPVIANMVRVAMRDKATPLIVANARNTGDFFPNPKHAAIHDYGAETALISALINAITDKNRGGLAHAGLTRSAGAVSMKEACKRAGVPESTINDMAVTMARNGSVLIFIGKQIHDHPSCSEIVKALSTLASLTGGQILVYREYSNSQGTSDMGLSPTKLPGYIDASDENEILALVEKWGAAPVSITVNSDDIFEDLSNGKIKAVALIGVDPTVHYIDGSFVRSALANAEFVLVTETDMTDSCITADVVLPSCVNVERDGTYTNNEGRVQLARKAVEPVGASKPEWEMFRDMGRLAGVTMDYDCAGDITDEIASVVSGYALATSGKVAFGDCLVSYPNADGKPVAYEFDVSTLDGLGDEDYPLIAVIGNSLYHLDSLSRHSPALNEIEPRVWVEICGQDAETYALSDGDEVTVTSPRGSIKAVARVSSRVRPGLVFIPKNYENEPAFTLVDRATGLAGVRIEKSNGQ